MAFTTGLVSFTYLPDEGALGLLFQTSAYHIFKQNIPLHWGFFSHAHIRMKNGFVSFSKPVLSSPAWHIQ